MLLSAQFDSVIKVDPSVGEFPAFQQDSDIIIGDYYQYPENGDQLYGNISELEDCFVGLGEEAGNCGNVQFHENAVDLYSNVSQPLRIDTEEGVVDCYANVDQSAHVNRQDICDLCDCCRCDLYGGCSSLMLPGDVYYYSSNSYVLCVKQNKPEKQLYSPTQQQVTPKSPGLNPNASVFLSCKSGTGVPDTGQWEHSDSGINSSSDYSYANGDISSDKSDAGVFSPTSDSPFQPEFTPLTDNQVFSNSDSNASISAKLDDAAGRPLADGQRGISSELPVSSVAGDGSVPMTGITYSSDNDGEVPVVEGSGTEDQLRQVLKQQLETYFSRENLSSDSYLQSQMDADQYVPITTVASLDQIQKFNCDIQLIVDLLRESTVVQVDEKGEKVRPNHNRCIVILREIPDSTPVEDVQNLFCGENCPKFVSCEFAHNNNWYVTFDSDADAQRAYRYLREEVRTFQGKPIMARIKANTLIRTSSYPPRKYAGTQVQPPQQQQQQPLQEVPTSSAPQQTPPFTAATPFTLMPNVSQYINGQQAIPFYPPPNPLIQTWPTANPTMLDPSMVLAMNGYQATNVKMNVGPNRNIPFTNNSMNRNNTRNQKMHSTNRPMNHERNDPPPRMMNHDRPPSSSNGNGYNKTSPRNSDSSQISSHPHMYQNRRLDGMGPHNHMMHGVPPPPPPNPQHTDNTNNNLSNSRIGGVPEHVPISQRFPGKSYKSRRRRDEEGAIRPARLSSSSQSPNSAGGMREGSQGRYNSLDKQFDYEPTSFPPLPGSANNSSSGEVFVSMLSDVVRGTAKAQVKEVTKANVPTTSSAPTTSTATPSCNTHTSTNTATRDKPSPSVAPTTRSVSPPPPPPPSSQPSQQAPLVARTNSVTSSQPPVSPTIRSTSKPVSTTAAESKSNIPSKGKTVVENTQSQLDDKSSSSAKLSYAQMVQRGKDEAMEKADGADKSDGESETPLQQSNKPNHMLKEQGQSSQSQKNTSAATKPPAKDSFRKDRNSSDREDFRKDYEGEPKEQRFNGGRRLKENRENREIPGEKFDRRPRRDFRERDGPRSSVGK